MRGGALLANLKANDAIGIEPNPAARVEALKRGIRVVESPAAIADDFADVVISNHALEHVLNPHGELVALRRVLRPGGRLVIFVPLDDFRSQSARKNDPNHHVYTWTFLLLGNLLSEAGFEVQRAEVVTHAWPPRTELFARLPEPMFDGICRIWSVAKRRRQVLAVATQAS